MFSRSCEPFRSEWKTKQRASFFSPTMNDTRKLSVSTKRVREYPWKRPSAFQSSVAHFDDDFQKGRNMRERLSQEHACAEMWLIDNVVVVVVVGVSFCAHFSLSILLSRFKEKRGFPLSFIVKQNIHNTVRVFVWVRGTIQYVALAGHRLITHHTQVWLLLKVCPFEWKIGSSSSSGSWSWEKGWEEVVGGKGYSINNTFYGTAQLPGCSAGLYLLRYATRTT